MEKKSKKLITCTLSVIFVSMLVLSTNIFAASQRKTISIHANYSPTVVSASKSGDYPYSLARCYSVYPQNGGTDTYTRIRVSVKGMDQSELTSVYVLNETNTQSTTLYYKATYTGYPIINFYFTGNSADAAYADVMYDGK